MNRPAISLSMLIFSAAAVGQGEHDHSHHQPASEAGTEVSPHVPPAPPSHPMAPMSNEEMGEIMAMDDAARFGMIAIDRLEWREANDAIGWEGTAWYGGDYNKLMLKSEGDWIDNETTHTRTELLWDRVVSSWWSLQAGVRYDSGDGPSRTWAALGIEGLAP
jgi:copper resistance protein B